MCRCQVWPQGRQPVPNKMLLLNQPIVNLKRAKIFSKYLFLSFFLPIGPLLTP
jgi:hypothetical protein